LFASGVSLAHTMKACGLGGGAAHSGVAYELLELWQVVGGAKCGMRVAEDQRSGGP
jgi:hypothetical protein